MSGHRVILYGADNRPLVADRNIGTSEVVRSVSFKLNLGNYQSMDFFCSQKAQCAADEADSVSVDLYDWCYEKVMASVKDVQAKQARKQAQMERRTA